MNVPVSLYLSIIPFYLFMFEKILHFDISTLNSLIFNKIIAERKISNNLSQELDIISIT